MTLEEFKELTKLLESSGGKNLNHREISSGPNKGQKAIGSWGILPNTVDNMLNRRKNLDKTDIEDELTKELVDNQQQLRQYLMDNPKLEERYTDELRDYVLRGNASPEQAAYRWREGHNIKLKDLPQEKAEKHPYVREFNRLRGLLLTRPK